MEYRISLKELLRSGLSTQAAIESRNAHGPNRILPPPGDPWWKLYLEKFDDPLIRILLVAAVLAIVSGWMKGDYLEGIAIIVTIFLATFLGFLNEWKARLEFDQLVQAKDETPVKVVRDGNVQTLPRTELVVRDVVFMETGDEVPADGELLDAVSLQVDESRLTGESFPVAKSSRENGETDCDDAGSRTPIRESVPNDSSASLEEVFPAYLVFRGTMIVEGFGVLRVAAVGNQTEAGKVAKSATEELNAGTPLGRQLERLGGVISLFGFTGALLIFSSLLLRGSLNGEFSLSVEEMTFAFLVGASIVIGTARYWVRMVYEGLEYAGLEVSPKGLFPEDGPFDNLRPLLAGTGIFALLLALSLLSGLLSLHPTNWFTLEHGRALLRYIMVVVAIIVVSVPEGLSMAVTLCLAYGMRRMMSCNNLVRKLHACETIGAATVICSDKTGTLTQNEMTVSEAAFQTTASPLSPDFFQTPCGHLVVEGISVNSTAHLCLKRGQDVSVGNVTEGALLKWLKRAGIEYGDCRGTFSIEQQWTFSPKRKFMATLGRSSVSGRRFLFVKGAPETIIGRCSSRYVDPGSGDAAKDRETLVQAREARTQEQEASIKGRETWSLERETWTSYLEGLQSRGMRTLGFALLELPSEAPLPSLPASLPGNTSEDTLDTLAQDLVWLGCVAISDPIRPEVPDAIRHCFQAGVEVKILTGDHPRTAVEIARLVGLWKPDDSAEAHMTGREFQELNDIEALERLQKLKILSRARPSDKLRVVSLLKDSGHVVAVTGDGANDAPALHRADVGLSMGKSGTDMAKEASDIILLDDSFASIATGILWGRALYLNIQRFLVFQLSINVAAVGLTLFGPILGLPIPLTVIQMLWVNLIMDTFAALALATEPPTQSLMQRPPRKKDDFIISPTMLRSIMGFGLSSFAFSLGLLLAFTKNGTISEERLSLFFTIFVMIQFWNLFNIRRFGLSGSALTDLSGSPWFLLVAAVILGGQIMIVQFGGTVFRTSPLSLVEWVLMLLGTIPVLLIPEILRFFSALPRENAVSRVDDSPIIQRKRA
ncbi:MAG: cation-translocating P-type ATPase [Candidatus Ozemobacteraceae bacterium]